MTEELTATEAVPQFGFKKRSNKAKASFRKKPATPPPASDSDFTSSDDEEGRRIKRRRKNVAVTASSATNVSRKESSTEQPSAGPAPLTSSNDATKSANWYDEELSAKNLLGSTRARPQESAGPDGTYKGAANYTSFIQKNPDAPNKQFGPIKAPTNVRTVTVMDFAPDVCKDYKQTGFCGFGDSCKFLHAREDYKQGWELDRDWEIGTNGKKLTGRVVSQRKGAGMADEEEDDDDDELLESIPFACIICKKPYTNPILTKCGHYFCESCALNRYRKNPSCAACGAGTGGVFNVAKKLTALLDKKRERARKQREEALANGEEVSDEEEEDSD
ncbi:Pre-mRNA-splicing factor cwc24 [Penicillium maclennaniae]|uniref:Pre-mRNA-splicing factor cwc24 n=1 Tax=Penicillium maclennaniae TaxID=1343394 RepID=UPI0025417343|nr:Pre-mRNA-splicing factor cwc24 [Penicillium maclennaniae]KAJ5664981.1 Pre-mRNA-splicing factor cwc24 [Penicillium maclennaniae]